MSLAELAAVARWCDDTDRLALEHFRAGVAFDLKADGTPVTAADRGIETLLRAAIAAEFPGDAVLGEEEGVTDGSAARRWILDPVDATTNFVRGVPIFATLVALEDAAGLALGFVSAPALRTRWWGIRGGGAFRDGAPIRVSSVASLGDAHVCTGGIDLFQAHETIAPLLVVTRQVSRQRGFGDFYGHMLVAQGSVEAMIDPVVSPWDLAACQIVVEEAGGRFTSLAGTPGYEGGNALASNGLVHDALVAAFSG